MPPAPFPQKGGMRFAGGSREQDSEPDDKHQQADRADAGGGVPKILPAPGAGQGLQGGGGRPRKDDGGEADPQGPGGAADRHRKERHQGL